MGGDRLVNLWWRGLCAAVLLLGLLAPQAVQAAVPDWLQAGICHAPDEQQAPSGPQHGIHTHCALCQFGQIADLPPVPPPVPQPRQRAAESAPVAVALWSVPGRDLGYASRAPPAFG
jgi:hypothetical protein